MSTLDEELRQIAGGDQVETAAQNLAVMVAEYWLTLVRKGISPDQATTLSVPLVIKALGGGQQ